MYDEEYSEIFITGRDGLPSKIMHRTLEKDLKGEHFSEVLEVGANKGEHLKHIQHTFDSYLMSDITKRLNSDELPANVSFQIQDVCNLTLPSNQFDLCIVTCVLQHVENPERAFRELLRVAKPGGLARILLQNDTTPTFQAIRKLSTVRRAKKFGVLDEVELFFAREHRNNFFSVAKLAEIIYKQHNFRSYSFPSKFMPAEIFRIIEFRKSFN